MSATSPNPVKLADLSVILRSKIAGPFLLSLEAFFESDEVATLVRRSECVTKETVAAAYGIKTDDIRSITWYSAFPAVKCVVWPPKRADAYDCRDVYGSQSHVAFGDLLVRGPGE